MQRKRYKIEQIRKQFKKRGCILKSTEYVNAHTKLDYVCPNGHEHSITWNNFQQGKGCPYCAGLAKLTIEFVKGYIEGFGWVLKSEKYINAQTKLDCICDKGHGCSITWNNFQQGKGCSVCAMEGRSTTQSHDMSYILEQFKKRKWTLKSEKYVNGYVNLGYICDKGHEGSISWTHFQQGIGCSTCFAISMYGENNPNWKGGFRKKIYCDAWYDKGYKIDISERDDYRCQNPYCSCNGGVLCIHHIDYDTMNCRPSNLITLCRACHGMSNGSRGWHKLWYQTIMNKKYGYTY